ncbi:hypothetical protein LWM68_46905 [Niabella sp. W65]|nr:hypothetical protein [Niabella sp. W65]MCH7369599.1 hypothetical protein [Niabella sp. W65]
MKPTGIFSTSDSLINQLQHNIQWGQRVISWMCPADCHQRDDAWAGQVMPRHFKEQPPST